MNLLTDLRIDLTIGGYYSELDIMALDLEPQQKLGTNYYLREKDYTIYYFQRINDKLSRFVNSIARRI